MGTLGKLFVAAIILGVVQSVVETASDAARPKIVKKDTK
uniref:Uncharacterized protein n=1 Tax=Pseudomonas phage RVTF4 TaxID=3236931 RepID=A0AB39CCY2_9VIRU